MPTLPAWFPTWLAARVDHFTRWDHFTTWLNHWQTLLAGILAFFAGFFALAAARWSVRSAERQARWSVEGAERLSRQKDQREIEYIRFALASEIRWLVNILLATHDTLTSIARKKLPTRPRDVEQLASLREPVVYPAVAEKVGLLEQPLAQYVITFYGNIQNIQFTGRFTANDPTETRTPPELLDRLADLLVQACRDNALPLLSRLPPDEADVVLRPKIEAMGRPPS
jgi:hypothetical protein